LDGDGHWTTANDLIKIAKVAMENPIFSEMVATREVEVSSIDGKYTHKMININKLLGSVDGVMGVKTGWTENAKENLVSYVKREDYAEETGFLGISVLVALYLSMAVSGFYIASKSIDKRGFYLASLITFLISFQAFLNLGVVSNLLPSKGVTLPFFSQGGTSLIVNIIGVSLLISIAAKNRKKWENIKEKS